MSVNVPLLRKMVEWVEAEEQLTEGREWYQGDWIAAPDEITADDENLAHIDWCNTAFCVAGKVALDAGWKPQRWLTGEYSSLVRKGGKTRLPDEVATEALGIDVNAADDLFDSANTAADIRCIAEDIAGERL